MFIQGAYRARVIYCGFAKVAVQTLLQKYTLSNHRLAPTWKEKVITDYNVQFRGCTITLLPTDMKYVSEKIVDLRTCLGCRWNPADSKAEYLKTFSLESWNSYSVASKEKHSLQSCTACNCNYTLQMAHFPVRSNALKRKSPVAKEVEV